ncbi:MAG: hypothetical protein H7X86_05755 [Gorillibacterium sp.]|nr:hypothetical protein [Gorillibacterium sp.]
MASYTQGSLAIKQPYRQEITEVQRYAKSNVSPKTLKLSALEKLFYIALSVVLTFLLGSLVLLNSQMYSINKDILDTKTYIKKADITGDELKKKLADIKNPTALSIYAEGLDFHPVTEDQKPSHNLNGQDEIKETASR